jgi:hypothetical protein
MVEHTVFYDVDMQQEWRKILMYQKGFESLDDYNKRSHPEINAVRNGLAHNIKLVRVGGGIFAMFPDGSYILLERDTGAPRMPGALDIFAGMVQPTSIDITANVLTGSKIELLLTEIEAVPVTYDGKKRTYYVFTPQGVEEAIARLVNDTQSVGIAKWEGSNPYRIEVNAGLFNLGVAQDGWEVIEFDPNGTKVFEKNALVSFEDHSVELIFPGLYKFNTDIDPTAFADIRLASIVDIEHGPGSVDRYDNGIIDRTKRLNRLVIWGGRGGDDSITVYYNGEYIRKFDPGEFVRWNPKDEKYHKITGYTSSLQDLVNDGNPGMTPKPRAVADDKGNGFLFDSLLRDDGSGKPIPVKVNKTLKELKAELDDILKSKRI